MDDELSERARRLVEVAMAQDVPPEVVVEDSWGMVISRVSADTERSSEPVATPAIAAAPGRAWLRIAITVTVVATVLGGVWLALRPAPAPPAAATPTRVAATPTPAVPVAAPPTAPGPPAAQLLDDAEAALATAPVRALELVDRHAALAPASDAERRMALRITVLCALGRNKEARAEATAFLARPRDERWSVRVRASCGAPAAGAR